MTPRAHALWGDRALLLPVVALAALGVVMVYSSSFVLATDRFGDGGHYLRRQALLALLGLAVLAVAALAPTERLARLARPALALALVLLGLTLVPGLGHRVGGSARWLTLGSLTVQPAEFAKVALVLWLAARLARADAEVDRWRGLLPRLAVVGLVVAPILVQPDLGTAVLLALVALAMLFVAGARVWHLATLALAALPALYLLVMRVPYRRARVLAFLDPWAQATGSGWQIIQSFVAFGSGGLFGRGLGEGQQKLLFLPESHTDFIAAVVAEELGVVGFSVMAALFTVLVARGLAVARRAPTPFAGLLASGAALLLGLQAAINLGVTLGCLPTKGLPLPFVSYGGSALVTAFGAAGLLLNVSAAARAPHRPRAAVMVATIVRASRPQPGERTSRTRQGR
jgi:cell division protein FtsW